jgi:hypothetical protein
MVESPFALCDFNSDGRCDTADFIFFPGATGKCIGDAAYNPLADIDGDGCVTLSDQDDLFTSNPIGVDIKPNSFPNLINCNDRRGVITVAILSTQLSRGEAVDFDAMTVDPVTTAFGPSFAREAHGRGHIEDVDSDGDLDLVLHFRFNETGIRCGDMRATLIASLLNGQAMIVIGSDSINTVP